VAGAAFESGAMALFSTGDSPLMEGEVTLPAVACKTLYLTGLKENARYEIILSGPNITTPTSIAAPGVLVKTEQIRANDKGVTMLDVDGTYTVRLRFQQI
jgi:hypothetical protein